MNARNVWTGRGLRIDELKRTVRYLVGELQDAENIIAGEQALRRHAEAEVARLQAQSGELERARYLKALAYSGSSCGLDC